MCTLLIIGRIWYMTRTMPAYSLSSARNVATIMLESGMLYFLVQLVFLTLYGMDHPGEQVIIPMAVQIYVSHELDGKAFMLMSLVRRA